jgi:hypothetical protein
MLFLTDGEKISVKCQGCKQTKIIAIEKLKNFIDKVIKIL